MAGKRWFGVKDDVIPAGSTRADVLGRTPAVIGDPDFFVPVTEASVSPGIKNTTRDDEARGSRAATKPDAFSSSPEVSFTSRAYPKLVKKVLKHAMGGAITSSGSAPAAITSKQVMADYGEPTCLEATILRETQQERVSGMAIGQIQMTFPMGDNATIAASDCQAKYHVIPGQGGAAAQALPTPTYVGLDKAYQLRRALIYYGDSSPETLAVTAFGFNLNNSLSDDEEDRFANGQNLEATTYKGNQVLLWYPTWNDRRGHAIGGNLGFRKPDPAKELARKLAVAEKLVVELPVAPISPATTPAAEEMLRLTFSAAVLTGGDGAGPITRDGSIRSAYDFASYPNATGDDFFVEYVSNAALT